MRQRVISLSELHDAQRELAAAQALFNEAQDPDMIDRAIALITAAEIRLKSLWRVRQTAA